MTKQTSLATLALGLALTAAVGRAQTWTYLPPNRTFTSGTDTNWYWFTNQSPAVATLRLTSGTCSFTGALKFDTAGIAYIQNSTGSGTTTPQLTIQADPAGGFGSGGSTWYFFVSNGVSSYTVIQGTPVNTRVTFRAIGRGLLGLNVASNTWKSLYVGGSAAGESNATLRCGVADALCPTSFVAVCLNSVLDLNGYDQTIGNLVFDNKGTGTIFSASPAVLTVNQRAASGCDFPYEYRGTIGGAISLVKSGPSNLTMTAANTYTGSTSVAQGRLITKDPQCLATGTVVRLYTGAKLKLDFAGTNTVTSLYVNDTPRLMGVYGAANLPDYLEGAGYLRTLWPPPPGTVIAIH